MNDTLIKAQYDVTKKSKLKKFYEEKKFSIFLTTLILLISLVSFSFYLEIRDKKKTLLADNYIEAKIYLENGQRGKAKNILKEIVLADDSTYSTLSLFLMMDENFTKEQKELLDLFDHVLKNNKFEKEVKNLIIFKKALFQSSFVNETELLETLKPLMNSESLWKPHALLLLGDYFFSKNEYLKAKEFYSKVLTLKGLHKELYEQARSQLVLIIDE